MSVNYLNKLSVAYSEHNMAMNVMIRTLKRCLPFYPSFALLAPRWPPALQLESCGPVSEPDSTWGSSMGRFHVTQWGSRTAHEEVQRWFYAALATRSGSSCISVLLSTAELCQLSWTSCHSRTLLFWGKHTIVWFSSSVLCRKIAFWVTNAATQNVIFHTLFV